MIQEFLALGQSSEGFQRAASAMMKTFHRLKENPSTLQLAMHMFGHYGANSLVSRQAQALWRAANRTGTRIAAQPTSCTRPKVKLGGRCRLAAGRLKKIVATMDHRYSYQKGTKSCGHSLSQAVGVRCSNPSN